MKKKKLRVKLDNIILFNSSIYNEEVNNFIDKLIKSKNKNFILINSNGGSCYDSFHLINFIRSLKRNIKIINTSNCGSGGLSIFCSVPKKNRFCYNNSTFFYHEALLDFFGSKNNGNYIDVYKSHCNQLKESTEKNNNFLKESGASDKFFKDANKSNAKELYMTPEEMAEYGLIYKKNILNPNQVVFY